VLTRYYDHISDSRVADRLYKIVKEQMDIIISPKNIVKLDSQLNEIYNDIMSRISVPSVHLSEKDIMTIRLLLAGLSVKSIGTLLDCSIHSIYKTKDRTMAKLKKESYSLYEGLAKLLEISSL
jgi:DNA-binding CsgD family transcriptional regulator